RPTTSRPSIPCAAAFVCCYSAPCPPPPFPTRRSSDLAGRHRDDPVAPHGTAPHHGRPGVHRRRASRHPARRIADVTGHPDAGIPAGTRSPAPVRAMTTTDPAGRADWRPGGRRRRTGWPVWVHLLAALLVMGLLQGFVARVYRVPSGSMEPTLAVGQRFLVERVSYRFADVQRQDVIVFRIDPQWRGAPDPAVDGPGELARWTLGLLGVGSGLEDPLVKRVIGLPGDTVACCDEAGRVLVNDVPLAEPYLGPDLAFAAGHHDCR